jgi:hypothetical protein
LFGKGLFNCLYIGKNPVKVRSTLLKWAISLSLGKTMTTADLMVKFVDTLLLRMHNPTADDLKEYQSDIQYLKGIASPAQ